MTINTKYFKLIHALRHFKLTVDALSLERLIIYLRSKEERDDRKILF